MKILRDCEDALGIALPEAKRGNASMADVLADVVRHLDKFDTPDAHEMSAVALFGLAQLDAAQGRHRQAQKRRAQAVALLDRVEAPGARLSVLDMIVGELMELNENRKALAYANKAVSLSRGAAKMLGVRLLRAARCHRRVGFAEAAWSQLREAVPLLRRDPLLLASALLELGNSGMKAHPGEAAEALREAAGLFEGKGDVGNAGVAWLNLGVALSQAGELDGALEAYEKARALRARNPATTVAQRGNLHNNLAGLYRRKRDFARARQEANEAINILKPTRGEFFAHALGTLGEIARDEGERQEALDMFAQARALFERLPGVGNDKLAVKLENEAEALTTLGRAAEAATLKARAAALRGEAPPTAPAIPLDKVAPPCANYDAVVTIALDGLHLAAEVYAQYDLAGLEGLLEERLAETGAGALDGHATGPQTTEIFLAGADARAMFDAVEPVLRDYPLCQGAEVELRQGAEVTRLSLARASVN